MAIYLHDKVKPNVPKKDIILDRIARNTEENARYTISRIKELKNDVFHRPIDILLMTSPYHIKRFSTNFQWLKINFLEYYINKIGYYITETKYKKDNWYLTEKGFKTYLSEYWKLHGGRVIGEF